MAGQADSESASWNEIELDGLRGLTHSDATARFLFEIGPAQGHIEPAERVRRLHKTLAPELTAVRWGRQVHKAQVAAIDADGGKQVTGAALVGECDALVTSEPGVGLLVWSADCVPVLLAAPGAIGAAHVGWRGAAAGAVAGTLRQLTSRYGVPPANIVAWLGPAIGPCHYSVGVEVVEALAATGVDPGRWLSGSSVDLRGLIAAMLEGVGVGRVERVGGCTACDPFLASYRRDGPDAGRQMSMVFRPARMSHQGTCQGGRDARQGGDSQGRDAEA